MAKKKESRKKLTIVATVLVALSLVYAFWPKPTLVDMGQVTRGHMVVTINEEARTQVHDPYTVSAPFSGRLLRVDAEPNDIVEQSLTTVAFMNPPSLDAREVEQARAAISAAEASLRAAQADKNKAEADITQARSHIKRAAQRREIGTISEAEFERAKQESETATAALDNAKAAIGMREAELVNAQAALIGIQSVGQTAVGPVEIKAPVNGRVLKVFQQSEGVIAAGTPILEIGNVEDDLEVLIELLSTDAVQVDVGDRVVVENWGGEEPLQGVVARIDPFGYTKFSALGVEEQRVHTIVHFAGENPSKIKLGHGFRVEVQIVTWESEDAVIVPSSALFRKDNQWAVFVVEGGDAKWREVEIEFNNGTESNVIKGLKPEDRVVLYPAAELEDGASVKSRQESE